MLSCLNVYIKKWHKKVNRVIFFGWLSNFLDPKLASMFPKKKKHIYVVYTSKYWNCLSFFGNLYYVYIGHQHFTLRRTKGKKTLGFQLEMEPFERALRLMGDFPPTPPPPSAASSAVSTWGKIGWAEKLQKTKDGALFTRPPFFGSASKCATQSGFSRRT